MAERSAAGRNKPAVRRRPAPAPAPAPTPAPAKKGRLATIGDMVERAARRPRQEWTNEVFEPDPDVDYTQVLAGPGQRAATTVAGLTAVVLGFFIIYPGIAGLICYAGWLARGRPGIWAAYYPAAVTFQYPEGMVAAHLGLASLIVMSMLMVRFVHQRRPVWLSSVQPGLRWRYLLIVAVVSAIVLNLAYWPFAGKADFHWNPQPDVWIWLVIIVLTGPLQAAGEEYLFRGYLMQVLGSFLHRPWVVVLISGAVFTIAHGLNQSLLLMFVRFVFGCVMGTLVVTTGGLEAAIAAHAVNNLFTFGYASLSGGVAASIAMTDLSWTMAASNILAYVVIGLIAWRIGVAMKVATETPLG